MSYEEIKSSHPKAKKQYTCIWCNGKIEIGEKHLSRAYKYEGDFQSDRMHLECEQGMNKSPHDIIAEGFLPGSFERGEVMS